MDGLPMQTEYLPAKNLSLTEVKKTSDKWYRALLQRRSCYRKKIDVAVLNCVEFIA